MSMWVWNDCPAENPNCIQTSTEMILSEVTGFKGGCDSVVSFLQCPNRETDSQPNSTTNMLDS